jgi:DNA-binding MarR family transcriptional regulator
MEVDTSAILRLLTALRECSQHVARGVAEHPLDEMDVGLLALAEAAGGTLRPSQAAGALETVFPSVTRHVRALQAAGHLAIDPDPRDRRSYRIVLTATGKALLEEFRQGLITRFAPVVAGWDPAELEQLADGLTRLAAAMTRERRAAALQPGRSSWWRADTTVKGEQP